MGNRHNPLRSCLAQEQGVAAISIVNKRPEVGQAGYDAVFDVVDREFVHVLLAGVDKIIRNCMAFQEWNYMGNNSLLLSNLTSFFASDKSDVYNVLNVFLQRAHPPRRSQGHAVPDRRQLAHGSTHVHHGILRQRQCQHNIWHNAAT